MEKSNGVHWLGKSASLVDNAFSGTVGEEYGNPGGVLAHATIDADVAANKAALIHLEGCNKISLKSMWEGLAGSTGADNGAEIWIWGLIGFGEAESDEWYDNPLFAYRLGGFNSTKGNSLTASTTTTLDGPGGATLTGIAAQTATNGHINAEGKTQNEMHPEFMYLATGQTGSNATAKQTFDGSDSDGNGHVVCWSGLDAFQSLLLTMNLQGHSGGTCNVVYMRH
tara:strand:- start:149 stop:823 length:675 start_codon:yes stop_codon:yes gene_type:complete